MTQYFKIDRCYDETLFDNMVETYKDKIIIPEQSKEADMYFYINGEGVYFFIDDMRNPEDIINQKLDNVSDMHSYYRGFELELVTKCSSGNTWIIYKLF